MTISNINLAMNASSYGAYQQRLTSATKAELDKLQIPYNPNISEQEGKALISSFKSKQLQKENGAGANFNNEQKLKKNDTFERAKELAQKLGISFDENSTTLQQLLSLIEQNLETKIQANKSNESLLKQLKGFSEELASIQAESMGASYDTTNQALEKSLEMLSLYNKNFLNN